ncbi:Syntaxin-binding protein 1, variant 3 [Schistosoma haematobium]|uniref:Syntaxin-binding protein 1, variant 3 n=1 Tax=Schistosoma haematobium TaxID=6185 RepID=A0A922LIT5_SCHHA|nr:Syntaxin-binding protein 1, variant 3 [Schistosoma haematobium]KAH9585606.1 Syntaxin-binding protein 1, variant 3 [Schistosoma haematobium]
MSMISEVGSSLRKYVFEKLSKTPGWKVLIMDDAATRVLSSCFKMQDITEYGVTLVESLNCKRQKLNMHAIYIMRPRRAVSQSVSVIFLKEIELLLQDFPESNPTYSAAHVFFLSSCPNDLLNQIIASQAVRRIMNMIQLSVDFIPLESHLYSLEATESAQLYFLPSDIVHDKLSRIDQIAEQLASVCITLQEYPKICYQKTESNLELARLVQVKLDTYKSDNPILGQGSHKDQSLLLIVDRSLDPVTPLLHELTLQAMCYDLLTVEENTIEYSGNRKANVADGDALWKEFRHQHVADVTRALPQRVREFAESKKQFVEFEEANLDNVPSKEDTNKNTVDIRDLSDLIKRMPQYQTESASYAAAYHIVETCMATFKKGVDKLCEIEQDLVMGENAKGEPITDPMRVLVDIFKYDFTTVEERLRLLLIFTLIKEGFAETHLDKLLDCAQVARSFKPLFASLSFIMNAQLIQSDPVTISLPNQTNVPQYQLGRCVSLLRLPPIPKVSQLLQTYLPVKKKRVDRVNASSYALSRWTPYILDIMEQAISGKLDKSRFGFVVAKGIKDVFGLGNAVDTSSKDFKKPSARFHASGVLSAGPSASVRSSSPNPGSDRNTAASSMTEHCGPRLIVFVVGGFTLSEARVGYQLTQRCKETRLAASDKNTNKINTPTTENISTIPGGGVGWNWEVVLGGTHLLTPKIFLDNLEGIAKIIMPPVSSTPIPESVLRRVSIMNPFRG